MVAGTNRHRMAAPQTLNCMKDAWIPLCHSTITLSLQVEAHPHKKSCTNTSSACIIRQYIVNYKIIISNLCVSFLSRSMHWFIDVIGSLISWFLDSLMQFACFIDSLMPWFLDSFMSGFPKIVLWKPIFPKSHQLTQIAKCPQRTKDSQSHPGSGNLLTCESGSILSYHSHKLTESFKTLS